MLETDSSFRLILHWKRLGIVCRGKWMYSTGRTANVHFWAPLSSDLKGIQVDGQFHCKGLAPSGRPYEQRTRRNGLDT